MIEKKLLDYVAGVPTNLFLNTVIPVCLFGLREGRMNKDVLMVDASNEFDKRGKQNVLNRKHATKLIDVISSREEIEKYSRFASFSEFKENGFNLNIPRYVDTSEPPKLINVAEMLEDIVKPDVQIYKNMKWLVSSLDMLTGFNEERKRRIKELRNAIEDSGSDGYRRFIQRQAHDLSKRDDMDRTGRIVGRGELPEKGRTCLTEKQGGHSEEGNGSHPSANGDEGAVSGLLPQDQPGSHVLRRWLCGSMTVQKREQWVKAYEEIDR